MSVVWEKGVFTGCISPSEFVAITSTNAARIFNLYPRKGCIAVGSDADLVIWNPNKTRVISAKTHHHAVDFNIFEGMECHGVPEYVLVSGRVCVDEGQLKVVQGFGRYIERPVFPPYVFHQLQNGSGYEKHLSELSIVEQKQDMNEHKGDQAVYLEEQTPQTAFTANDASTPCCKGARPESSRNLQDSTFSLSSENETDVERRSCIKVKNPPGGKSSGFW
ncbi:dihydropyrimidinase-related protein 2 [Agrilus planipennis]|uniref:dihydropyrimidinase n=1 Tax=Agrilus planipennis TaxID=224129 RepID=A0A7F5RN17_AGRPL|nr:dihydropyrimidinase-related protein 2 [Agrilus planipennis]